MSGAVGKQRVVVVTGAGGDGCGRAIAKRFAADGAAVIVSDINNSGGLETHHIITQLGGLSAFFQADVRSEGQVKDLLSFAEESFGPVDVLINNASAPHGTEDDLEGWMEPLKTDLLGSVYATRWAIESMRRHSGGAIVNIASISALWHGRKTPGGLAGYDVAKAGLIRMTTRLASLAEKHSINVNCLAPGWIATEVVRHYWESLTVSERVEHGVPTQLITPQQVAEATVRLAEDRSLAGRVVVWWSEDEPKLIRWGDRGYRELATF